MKNNIKNAVDLLRQGELISIPTETVYGLAADAKNPAAVEKIFLAKGRPANHPLIVHISDISQLNQWAISISEQAFILAKTFWPGPLTLILKKAPDVLNHVTGGQDTIGIRIPSHPIAQLLLKEFGGGVAAPSANRFGRISPTTAEAVREELGGVVKCILDGGQCEIGVESTIVDVSGGQVRILRPGKITAQQIENVLQQPLSLEKSHAPRVSGMLESHYAPMTQTILVDSANLNQFLDNLSQAHLPAAVMTFSVDKKRDAVFYKSMPISPEQYAHDLYSTLRELDKQNFQCIIIEAVPDYPEWNAIRDRLQRAACLFY